MSRGLMKLNNRDLELVLGLGLGLGLVQSLKTLMSSSKSYAVSGQVSSLVRLGTLKFEPLPNNQQFVHR